MRLRSFTAPNMAEAIRKVREEFGPDAIIVSSQYRGPGLGVQVTAAFERDPLEEVRDDAAQIQAAPVPRQALTRGGGRAQELASVAETAADADPATPSADETWLSQADLAGIPDPLAFGTALDAAIDHAVRRQADPPADPAAPRRAEARPARSQAARTEEAKGQEAKAGAPRRQTVGKPGAHTGEEHLRMLSAAEELARTLAWHGVPVRLNERLTLAAAALGLDDQEGALAQSLAQTFRFVPIPATPERPIVLVGPNGSGKTLTCAKLAARAVLAGIRVTVVSADTGRAGAIAQLSTFIDLLRQPMVTVDSPEEMARAVERARASGPVFVDTPGINPFQPAETGMVRDLVSAAAGDGVAVLAAGGDPAEAGELAAIFAEIGARQLIATRLDATRRYGAILAAAEDGRLRLANLSLTPFVAAGLVDASAGMLARLLLRDPEAEGAGPAGVGPEEGGSAP